MRQNVLQSSLVFDLWLLQDEDEALLEEMQSVKDRLTQKQRREKKRKLESKRKFRLRAAQLAKGAILPPPPPLLFSADEPLDPS